MEWFTAVLGTVLQVGVDWFRSWYAAEKAESDRWAARTKEAQLASFKRAMGDSQAVADAAVKATAAATPAEWNAPPMPPENVAARTPLGLGLALCCLLLLPGCIVRAVYVEAAVPTISAPARPAVPVESVAWTDRERLLVGYATALEAAISEHNRRARERNAANGY